MEEKYTFLDDETLEVETHVGVFKLSRVTTINFPDDFKGEIESLEQNFTKEHGIYCLAEKGKILYVGKSDESLRKRISGYIVPGIRQETNIRIKNNLLSRKIDVFFMSEENLKKMTDLFNICKEINKNIKRNYGETKQITINRCAEMLITGYCFGKTFLNK